MLLDLRSLEEASVVIQDTHDVIRKHYKRQNALLAKREREKLRAVQTLRRQIDEARKVETKVYLPEVRKAQHILPKLELKMHKMESELSHIRQQIRREQMLFERKAREDNDIESILMLM